MDVVFEKVLRKRAVSLKSLAPTKILTSIGDVGIQTVAAVDREKPLSKVCAVLQYHFEGDTCVLKWIYVDAKYRGNGVGRAMLENLYKEAKETGACKMRCLLYQGSSVGIDVTGLSDFLLSAGFDKKEPVDGLNCISGKELLANFSANEMALLKDHSNDAIAFSKLNPDEIIEASNVLGLKNIDNILVADKNMSCVYKSDGKYMGLLAFKKRGHYYSLSELKVLDEAVLRKIFWYTIYSSFRNIHVNDHIVIKLNMAQELLKEKALPAIGQKDAVWVTKEF